MSPEFSGPRSLSRHELVSVLRNSVPDLARSENLEIVRGSLLSPIRGFVDPELRLFRDLTHSKATLIHQTGLLLNKTGSDALRKTLWQVATSSNPGLDVNRWAAMALSQEEHKPTVWTEELTHIALSTTGKASIFAAKISSTGFPESDRDAIKLRQLAEMSFIFDAYTLSSYARKISDSFGSPKVLHTLEAYRILLERGADPSIQISSIPDFLQSVKLELAEKSAFFQESIRSELETYGPSPTIGIEIQGISPSALPGIEARSTEWYSTVSPEDYQRVVNLAGFINSRDQYYEFSPHPTTTAYEQSATLNILMAMGLVKNTDTSLHVTLADLKTSQRDRVPAAIQNSLLSADLLRSSTMLRAVKPKTNWNLGPNKRALHHRLNVELKRIPETVPPEVASELRVLSVGDPGDNETGLLVAKVLGKIGVEYQNNLDGRPYNPELVSIWESLSLQINKLLKTNGLPKLHSPWRMLDLERLDRLIENNSPMSASVRSILENGLKGASAVGDVDVENEVRSPRMRISAGEKISSEIARTYARFIFDTPNQRFLTSARRGLAMSYTTSLLMELVNSGSLLSVAPFAAVLLIIYPEFIFKTFDTVRALKNFEPKLEVPKARADLIFVTIAALVVGLADLTFLAMSNLRQPDLIDSNISSDLLQRFVMALSLAAISFLAYHATESIEPIETYND